MIRVNLKVKVKSQYFEKLNGEGCYEGFEV